MTFIAGLIIFLLLFPYLFTVSSAFKTQLQAKSDPPTWIFKPTIVNFRALKDYNFLHLMKNSAIIALISTTLTILVSLPTAYGVSRFKLKLGEPLLYLLLVFQLIPAICVVFPYYYIADRLGLVDTHILLVLIYNYWNIPWAIWLLRSFLDAMPWTLEEQAMIDGCNHFQAFYKVTLPLIVPGLAAVSIIIFIFCWNEFTLANFLTAFDAKTLPTIANRLRTHAGVEWGSVFAATTVSTIPTIIFMLLVRKYFVKALTFGAIKQ